jgi:hypothetical protein
MNQSDERRCLWLAEAAAWLQAYRKAQVNYRARNRLINAAILRQREQRPHRPWYLRLWRAITKGA